MAFVVVVSEEVSIIEEWGDYGRSGRTGLVSWSGADAHSLTLFFSFFDLRSCGREEWRELALVIGQGCSGWLCRRWWGHVWF